MPISEMSALLHSWYCHVACLWWCQTKSFSIQNNLHMIWRAGVWSVIVWHQCPKREGLRPFKPFFWFVFELGCSTQSKGVYSRILWNNILIHKRKDHPSNTVEGHSIWNKIRHLTYELIIRSTVLSWFVCIFNMWCILHFYSHLLNIYCQKEAFCCSFLATNRNLFNEDQGSCHQSQACYFN